MSESIVATAVLTNIETWTLRETLHARYGEVPELHFGEVQMRLAHQETEEPLPL